MAFTPNSQAIGIVNTMCADLMQMYQAYLSTKSSNAQWNNLPNTLAATLAGFETTGLTVDGSLETTPDPAPVLTHPININRYSNMIRALSHDDIVSLNTLFGAFIALMEGGPVSQQGQAPGLIAKIIGT